MNNKIRYRLWQFWQSLKRSPRDNDWAAVQNFLSQEELDLIKQLPAADQNHSLRVFRSLQTQGEDDPNLIKAALLHDLGKLRYPLRRWERIYAVLVTRFFPQRVKSWGESKPAGLRRPLAVIHQHPCWGAEIARTAGSSTRTVWFIKNHEMDLPQGSAAELDLTILKKLQKADNNT